MPLNFINPKFQNLGELTLASDYNIISQLHEHNILIRQLIIFHICVVGWLVGGRLTLVARKHIRKWPHAFIFAAFSNISGILRFAAFATLINSFGMTESSSELWSDESSLCSSLLLADASSSVVSTNAATSLSLDPPPFVVS